MVLEQDISVHSAGWKLMEIGRKYYISKFVDLRITERDFTSKDSINIPKKCLISENL